MRLANMLLFYVLASGDVAMRRVSQDTGIGADALRAWVDGDESALTARDLARLQCWCFQREAPPWQPSVVDSEGGEV